MIATRLRLVGRARRSGAAQYYVDFNGSTSRIPCGADSSLENLHDAAMTVEAWIRPDGYGENNFGYICSKYDAGSKGWVFAMSSNASIGLTVTMECYSVDAYSRAGLNEISADGNWYHVAFTWDDASYNYPLIWVNGEQVGYSATQNRVGAINSDAGVGFVIGDRENSQRSFNGGIAWVRISNTIRYTGAFTPPAKDSPPAIDGDTVEQWNFNEGSGTTAAAQVSTPTNDGTITNGTWGSF